MTHAPRDNDPCDKRKKAKLGCHPERLGPQDLFVGNIVGLSGEGTMKTRDSGDIPGAGGKGARPETEDVVGKIGDYHVDDLLGKSVARGNVCGGGVCGGMLCGWTVYGGGVAPEGLPLRSGWYLVPQTFEQFDR